MSLVSPPRRLLLATLAALAAPSARAQPTPRTLRIVVPYPAGGTQDAMMRAIQEPLGKLLGQTVLVDNRPGAAGMIGSQEVRRAAPDGQTLLLFNNGMSITPLVQKVEPIDFARDFVPVGIVAEGPLVIYAHAATPYTDVKGLIEAAKAKPGTLNYGSTGTGGLGHLVMETFARKAGIQLVHVPYKGQAPAMLAVIGGEVPLSIGTVSDTTLQSVRAGKLKALGVSTAQASPAVPGVPPIANTVAGFDLSATYGFLAPPGTPAAIAQRINAALVQVMAQADIRARYLAFGNIPRTGSPEAAAEFIETDAAQWRATVKAANIVVS